ncbi:hypothetical protein RYX36_015646 [Vicia faba]
MNVPGLTIQQVASHLQKFKLHLKRATEENKKSKVGKKKIKMGWVLVMDRDTITLNSIMEMCIRCNYLVTTCCNASFALNFLKKIKNLYDVILIEAQMPDMNSYHFLQHVTQQIKIPVIMMCVDQSITPSLMMKAIEKGAYGYWIKPLSEGQINNIWQHVVRKVLKENN